MHGSVLHVLALASGLPRRDGPENRATLSNDEIVQLRRIATGAWLIDKAGDYELPAELRRKLITSGRP